MTLGDSVEVETCPGCSSPVIVTEVPIGQPMVFLITGFCRNCGTTLLWVDPQDADMKQAATQIGDYFYGLAQEATEQHH